MAKIDYGWIVFIVIALIGLLLWKPIAGYVSKVSGSSKTQQAYERGKAIFYDTERWEGPGSYKSCAMCHAADFKPEPGKEIKMPDYVAGKPVILTKIRSKYGNDALGTGDALLEKVNNCLSSPQRIGSGPISANAQFAKDLLVYVSRQ